MARLPNPIREVLSDDVDEALVRRAMPAGARVRRRRELWVRAQWGLAAALLAAVLVLFLRPDDAAVRGDDGSVPVAIEATAARSAVQRFSDGSVVTVAPSGRVVPLAMEARAAVFLLERGVATFDVTPGGPRRWSIECGLLTVEVIGTRFTIDRSDARVVVRVERGEVLVRGERVHDRIQRLGAGDSVTVQRAYAEHVSAEARGSEHDEGASTRARLAATGDAEVPSMTSERGAARGSAAANAMTSGRSAARASDAFDATAPAKHDGDERRAESSNRAFDAAASTASDADRRAPADERPAAANPAFDATASAASDAHAAAQDVGTERSATANRALGAAAPTDERRAAVNRALGATAPADERRPSANRALGATAPEDERGPAANRPLGATAAEDERRAAANRALDATAPAPNDGDADRRAPEPRRDATPSPRALDTTNSAPPAAPSPRGSDATSTPSTPVGAPNETHDAEPGEAPRPTTAPLDRLARADAARRERDFLGAVAELEAVVAQKPPHPQAGLAAFTLGAVELDDLNRPRRALAAFDQAIARRLPALLLEDAYARRVEALHRLGDPRRAKAAAEAYFARYPNGRRTALVERWSRAP